MFNAVMTKTVLTPEVDALVRATLRERLGPPLSERGEP
jgi:hypothetical protein